MPSKSLKLLTFLITLWHSQAQASPALFEYDLVFSDEFNGTTLDNSKWSTTHLWGPFVEINGEEQYYVDSLDLDQSFPHDPFLFTGTSLKIRASKSSATQTAPAQPDQYDPIWLSHPDFQYNGDYDQSDRNYLSGIISSVNSFNMTHGYVETRAKLPAGQGLWSAFWLLNAKYVEDVPEIDIMENLGHDPNKIYHTAHYFDIENGWQAVSTPSFETTGPDFSSNFHTFGVAWDPRKITWYVDGAAVKTITNADFLIAKQSMYIIANLAVGGSWPGSPNAATQFPADYEIDYIRAYQRKPVANIAPSTLASEYQLMFSDEFNGSTLDPSKWNTSYLWGPFWQINNEEQYYVDIMERDAGHDHNPFDVSNGNLTITATAVGPSEIPTQPNLNNQDWQDYPAHQYNPDFKQSEGWTPNYLSGVVTSYDSFKFVHGYVEARMQLPSGSGLWPAFWLLNGYYVGPMPEIDIMEFDGAHTGTIHHSYHYHDTNGVLISNASQTVTGGPYSDSYHTYGVQWEPGLIKWYLNGNVVKTISGPTVSLQLSYIIANLAVGGNFVGDVDNSKLPASLKIDYIRAYQRKDSEPDTLDTIPPDTTISIPAVSTNYPPLTINIQGTVTDNGGSEVKHVQIAIRDTTAEKWVDIDGSTSGGWHDLYASLSNNNWNLSTSLPAGNYNLFVRGSDNSNNEGQWNTRQFTIQNDTDTAAPVSIITNPAAGSTPPIFSNTVNLAGTVSDEGDSGVKQVQIAIRDVIAQKWVDIDGTSTAGWYDRFAAVSNNSWALPTSLPAGTYNLFVSASDNNNNIEQWKTRLFTIKNNSDTTAPVTTIDVPATSSTYSNTLILAGAVSDEGDSGVKQVQIAIRDILAETWMDTDGNASTNWYEHIATLSNGNWSIATSLPAGNYNLFVRATDNSNNVEQWKTRLFTINNNSDTTAPVTTINVPATSATYSNTLTLAGAVSDEGDSGVKQVQIAIRDILAETWMDTDGNSATSWYEHIATLSNGNWSIATSLPAGNYNLFVRATDNSNNVESWNTRLFTINQ